MKFPVLTPRPALFITSVSPDLNSNKFCFRSALVKETSIIFIVKATCLCLISRDFMYFSAVFIRSFDPIKVMVCNLKSVVPINPNNGPPSILYEFLSSSLNSFLFIFPSFTSVPSRVPLTKRTFDILAPNVER